MHKPKQTLRNNESGLVSIIVTVILMLVISLIVLGFAKFVRREQRQALDRQLNTQAFYAAESGVNDAIEAIEGGYSSAKTECGPPAPGPLVPASLLDNQVDAAKGVSISCLLINPTPDHLLLSVKTTESTLVPIKNNNGTTFTSIEIYWSDQAGGSDFSCGPVGEFTTQSTWPCETGALRVDLVPLANPTRDNLIANTFSAVFFPTTGSGTIALVDAQGRFNQGAIVGASCLATQSPGVCKVTIDTSAVSESSYYLKIRSLYRTNTVRIIANDITGRVLFSGAQAIVDSTGKANDILRRVQVRKPLYDQLTVPDFGLQTADTLCKRLHITQAGVIIIDLSQSGGIDTTSCTP